MKKKLFYIKIICTTALALSSVFLKSAPLYMPRTIHELKDIVRRARVHGCKVALVGTEKSQGGQTTSSHTNAYRISLCRLNALISLNASQKQVTVQAGITWKQLQEHIAPQGLAVKAMQSYNDFSIGGSLAVNAHGQDVSIGQLATTVLSLRVLLPNGKLITASRNKNSDVFYAIIGGYGLVGIIATVTLQLTDDVLLERHTEVTPAHSLAEYFNQHIRNNPVVEFYSARFSVGHADFMQKALVITYRKCHSARNASIHPLVAPQQRTTLTKYILGAMGSFPWLKNLRFPLEQWIVGQSKIVSRNAFSNYSIHELPQDTTTASYILQEYFLPYDQLTSFIEVFSKRAQHYSLNIINITARHVKHDRETLLSYAPHNDMCALVVYIKLSKTKRDQNTLIAWTRDIIDHIIAHHGTYYLPYHLLATQEQFETIYPRWRMFLSLKQTYDPDCMLSNQLYEKYAPLILTNKEETNL